MKPNKIILYLGDDIDRKKLPRSLKKLQKKGLSIRFVNGNLMSHKKYYYAFREFPNDLIITVDDDLLFERDMIKQLYETYSKYPYAVCAKRVHKIVKDLSGNLYPYNKWLGEYKEDTEPSMTLFATTGAGTLFLPNLFDKELFNSDMFMKKCKTADDVWMKFMEIRCGIPVVFAPGMYVLPPYVPNTQEEALFKINTIDDSQCQSKNDIYIHNLENEYKLKLKDYV